MIYINIQLNTKFHTNFLKNIKKNHIMLDGSNKNRMLITI
jgi:hypothetical protein